MTMNTGPTVANILDGIDYFALLARERLDASRAALEEGDFDAAFDRAEEAIEKLKPLAFAQNNLASFASTHRIVRAEELQPGMVLVNVGTIEEITAEAQPGGNSHCYTIGFVEEGRADVHVHDDSAELVIRADVP